MVILPKLSPTSWCLLVNSYIPDPYLDTLCVQQSGAQKSHSEAQKIISKKVPNCVILPFESLQCPFWKFSVFFIHPYITAIFCSLLVWIVFFPWHILMCMSRLFSVMVAMFIMVILCTHNSDVIFVWTAGIWVLVIKPILEIVYHDTHVSETETYIISNWWCAELIYRKIKSIKTEGGNCFEPNAHG